MDDVSVRFHDQCVCVVLGESIAAESGLSEAVWVYTFPRRRVDVVDRDVRSRPVVSTDGAGVPPMGEDGSLEGTVTGYGATIEGVE